MGFVGNYALRGLSPQTDGMPVIPKKEARFRELLFQPKRQRPTFPGSLPPSIISAKELNFCVRYGNRCDLLAIATAYLLSLLYCTLKTE